PDMAPPPLVPVLNELHCAEGWAELATVDGRGGVLEGWWLSDRAVAPDRRVDLTGLALPAGGFVTVDVQATLPGWCDSGFVYLGDPAGVPRAEVDVRGLPAVGSWGRLPDRDGPWQATAPTPGAPNRPVQLGRPVLNEVDCQGRDWIELYNPTEAPVDLAGWAVTDDPARPERAYPLAGALAPGAFASVRQADGGEGFDFGIGCGGERVVLLDPQGAEADGVEVPALLDDTTWGRLPDGLGDWAVTAPTRGEPNVRHVDPTDAFFDPLVMHTLAIEVGAAGRTRLDADPRQYVGGLVTIDGGEPLPAGVRLKGRIGSFRPLDRKSGFKLNFDFGLNGGRFLGIEKLAVNNMVQDRSKTHEFAAYALFRAMGVASPRVSYARVTFNGEDFGLYLLLEIIDGPALDRWFPSTTHMYEGAYGQDLFAQHVPDLDKDQGDLDRGQLWRLVDLLDETPLDEAFEATLDLIHWPQVVNMMATELWIAHWDGYAPTRNNYYLHFDGDERLSLMPWGTDQTFVRNMTFYEGRGRLKDVCLADADCRALWDQALVEVAILVGALELEAQVGALGAWLRPHFEADPRREHSPEQMDSEVTRTQTFLRNRGASLQPLIDCVLAEDQDADDDGASCLVDCDDQDPSRFPGALDVCGDGVDQDCSGFADDHPDCPDCQPVLRGAHRYLVCPTPRTWEEAQARCLAENSQVLILDTDEEARWIHGEAQRRRGQPYWIGLTDGAVDGDFRWVDGTRPGLTRWLNGQPNGGADEACVVMSQGDAGAWQDRACDERRGTVCEDVCLGDPDPDGDGVTACAGDCAPEDPTAFPGAQELCGNAVDEDCDDEVDDGDRCPQCEIFETRGRAYRVCRSGRDWAQARAECQALGQDLVVLNNRQEHDDVLGIAFARANPVWIGLGDHAEEGHFVWLDGTDPVWAPWRPNEPNDFQTGEDCTQAYPNGWNDLWCDRPLAFVCETPCDPATDADGDGIMGCGADCDDGDPLVGAECPPAP
ncbi:MAG: CotH kinase family protein, partial [Myxococcales bacterium]|nr:CotH kinase family protein [Myxococcales bacterium]